MLSKVQPRGVSFENRRCTPLRKISFPHNASMDDMNFLLKLFFAVVKWAILPRFAPNSNQSQFAGERQSFLSLASPCVCAGLTMSTLD